MYKIFFLGTFFAVILSAYALPAQDDPVAIFKKHADALNRGDVAAVLAFYADEAFIDGPPCVAAPCVGKAAIEKAVKGQVADKQRVTSLNDYVSGNVLVRRAEVRSDRIRKAGVERVITWAIIELKGGKIIAIRRLLERTDPQSARFLKWQQEQARSGAR